MQLVVNLSFNGQCEAAFKLYEQALGGAITMMLRYSESPMAQITTQTILESAPESGDKIMHATMQLGGQTLTGTDYGNYQVPQGFALQLNVDDPVEAEHLAETLADGGTVHMPLQTTFWAERYAVITDRFGTPWKINCGKRG
jgi:PhnB protein